MISYPHSYILTTDEYSPYSSDEETFSTLPMIVNTHSIKSRIQPLLSSYRTVIDDEPFVYQHLHTPIPSQISSSSSKRNVHLPKHTKKLVNRFLNNLQHAHSHKNRDDNDSDSSLDDCDVCSRLRSAMNEEKQNHCHHHHHPNRIIIKKQNSSTHTHSKQHCNLCHLLEQSHISTLDKSQQDKHVHFIGTYPTNPPLLPIIQPTVYHPSGYNTYIDPNTGLCYTYDPNWNYNSYPSYVSNNIQTLPSTMDKSTYTRMANENEEDKSNEKTIIIHSSRNLTPRSPKFVYEEPRRHHRKSRKHRSKTLITERTTRMPHHKTSNYI